MCFVLPLIPHGVLCVLNKNQKYFYLKLPPSQQTSVSSAYFPITELETTTAPDVTNGSIAAKAACRWWRIAEKNVGASYF